MPHAQARLLLLAFTACAAGAPFPAPGVRVASAEPAEFLPSFHALYEDLEALVARGLLPSYPIHTRPLVRADLARALIEARDKDAAIESDLHYQRLARELAREIADQGSTTPVGETGPLLDVGSREQRFRIAIAGH